MLKLSFFILALFVSQGFTSDIQTTPKLKFGVLDLANIVEGIIMGVIDEEFQDLDVCIKDGETIGDSVYLAIQDFELETYEGIKEGLEELGSVIELIPKLTIDCKCIKDDLSKLEKMAEIFSSPFSLIYHVGKNLIVNGVDIFVHISSAVSYFKTNDYYNFGREVGMALSETFLQTPHKEMMLKDENDLAAYKFLVGFEKGTQHNLLLDHQQLYNNIDQIGMVVYGPVQGGMKDYEEVISTHNQAIWITLHEISHSFLEGAQILVAKGAITEQMQSELMKVAQCLNEITPNQINKEIEELFEIGYQHYLKDETKMVGVIVGKIANILCGESIVIIS